MWGLRVVIPSCYYHNILSELHKNHPGMSRMKLLSRLHIWFSSIDKEIGKFVKTCETCEKLTNIPNKTRHTLGIDRLSLWILFILITLNSKITNFQQWWIVTVNGSKLKLPIPGRQTIPLKH